MPALSLKSRAALLILLGCIPACAQTATEAPAAPLPVTQPAPPGPAGKPLPDIPTLMRDVEANQHKAETIQKEYIYHSVETEQETGSHGQIKKTTVTEADHYWVDGVPVRRMVKRNGKLLTPEELAKEDARIDERAAKARERRGKADAQGKQTDPRGEEEITVSRLLQLGAFTNPRRVQLHGRDTIAVDYAGDPKAKTRNRGEEVIRDMAGTAWVDEQDRVLARVEGHFVNAFKVGGGLVADIQKDTHFVWEQTKINDEVWLPAKLDAHGAARMLLFYSFNGGMAAGYSDYRKFRATSTVLPGVTRVATPDAPDHQP
jgi:hypothetical protein